MPNNALYAYGLAKSNSYQYWNALGIKGKPVFIINKGKFIALVHKCDEKPYTSEDPNEIKELVIKHNKILNYAIKHFGAVIPLPFNTIIKNEGSSSENNIKNWINDNREKLEKIWDKIKGKNEYGIRIYYEKDLLMQEARGNDEVKNIEKSSEGKSKGLNYLLRGKVENKINEIFQNEVNQSKQKFCDDIKKVTEDVKINTSRVFIDEEKSLLLSLSVLVGRLQTEKIKKILKREVMENKRMGRENFSFQLVGPFPPYSFVEDEI